MSPSRIFRHKAVLQYVGVVASTWDDQVKRGEAPAPIPLNDTGTAKGWLESEIVEWQEFQVAKRDGTTPHKSWREYHDAKAAVQP